MEDFERRNLGYAALLCYRRLHFLPPAYNL